MVTVKDLKFGELVVPVVFSSNALFKLEKETGLSTERIGLMMATGRAGYQMMQIILWAGIEAARVRANARRNPWTIEEIGDLLDMEGGSAIVWAGADDGIDEVEEDGVKKKVQKREPRALHPVAVVVMDAWTEAFPKPREVAPPPNPPTPVAVE